MASNKTTTILDMSNQRTKVVDTIQNDKLPHLNLAEFIAKKEGNTADEIIHKYRLKSERMPNGLDYCCWCEKYMYAAIQRLNK